MVVFKFWNSKENARIYTNSNAKSKGNNPGIYKQTIK